MYDKNIRKSVSFNLPVICIGNLSVGGTGKSPMTEYLLRLLKDVYPTATLSRGYKRKTKGYVLAGENTTALEIGDEPMQFHLKFPDVAVTVGEQRIAAIPQLLHDRPETKVIILDDAFQHREIEAGLNIVLTDYNNPYFHDWYLPSGDLRDDRSSIYRAQVIIVTKCPPQLGPGEKQKYIDSIKPQPGQQVYFTCIAYGTPYHIMHKTPQPLTTELEVLLVCGIANPKPLKEYLEKNTASYIEKSYNDHHIFSIDDWKEVEQRFKKLEGKKNIILTTEKDAVRLVKFGELLNDAPVFVLPVTHQFLFNEGHAFNKRIVDYINGFNNG